MTTLVLATRLQGLSDIDLIAALNSRTFRAGGVVDFFDLAEALLAPHSVYEALRHLDRTTLAVWLVLTKSFLPLSPIQIGERLAEYPATQTASIDEVIDSLHTLDQTLLVYSEHESYRSHSSASAAQELREADRVLQETPPSILEPVLSTDQGFVDRRSAERADQAVATVSGLVAELDAEPARQLHKGGLSLPAVKKLAEALATDHEVVMRAIRLASHADLISLSDGYWTPKETAKTWNREPVESRWRELATRWSRSLPDEIREMLTRHSHPGWNAHARDHLLWRFPLDQQAKADDFDAWSRESEWLGVTADSVVSSAGLALLHGNQSEAQQALKVLLPATVSRVYLQDDLSVVSPGPLAPKVSTRLRTMAALESRTLAPTFRFSHASLDHALTLGETADTIRSFLHTISLTGLPQPLEYLIDDVARRHGVLRARPNGQGTILSSSDGSILGEIEVDRRLRSLSLERGDGTTLVTRLPLNTTYWLLRGAKHPVVAENADGSAVVMPPPRTSHGSLRASARKRPEVESDHTSELVRRLRENAARTMANNSAESAEQSLLIRELDQAIRARQLLSVVVLLADESTSRYTLEPTALAKGRLRGLDRGADIERTLPVSRIVSIEAWAPDGSVH